VFPNEFLSTQKSPFIGIIHLDLNWIYELFPPTNLEKLEKTISGAWPLWTDSRGEF